ncbi:MAG: hypothetical protein ACTSWN_02515 [Promethearchaeota archaeon]
MKPIYKPKIIDVPFKELSEKLLESVLERTLKYDYYDYFLDHEIKKKRISKDFNYVTFLEGMVLSLLEKNWFLIEQEPSENKLPVFIFQKEGVNILIIGGRANDLNAVMLFITASTSADLSFTGKELDKLFS